MVDEITGRNRGSDLRCASTLALRGQSRQARQRIGDRLVRQLADVFGRNRFDNLAVVTLCFDGVFNACADARYSDFIERFGLGFFLGGCFSLLLRLLIGSLSLHTGGNQ